MEQSVEQLMVSKVQGLCRKLAPLHNSSAFAPHLGSVCSEVARVVENRESELTARVAQLEGEFAELKVAVSKPVDVAELKAPKPELSGKLVTDKQIGDEPTNGSGGSGNGNGPKVAMVDAPNGSAIVEPDATKAKIIAAEVAAAEPTALVGE